MRHHHLERLPSFSYRGLYRYSLTFCTDHRRRTFVNSDVVELVESQILRAASEKSFAVIAYCFMPDHLHLLAEGKTDDADARRFIGLAKQYSGYYYKKEFNDGLWQRYGFERVLRSDEGTRDVVRYILQNPVRAGLVTKAEDYPFLGSGVYSVIELMEYIQQGDRNDKSG